MQLPSPFRSSRSQYILIGLAVVASFVGLYFIGLFFIQTIMLVAYAACFPMILLLERNKRGLQSSLSEDERWSKTKSRLEKIDIQIAKAKNQDERRSLTSERTRLQNELRTLEWKIRETEMNQLYNASRGKMKPISDSTAPSEINKAKVSEKKVLLNIAKNIEFIIQHEEPSTLGVALSPFQRELKLHYNILKKSKNDEKKNSTGILTDYWVTWLSVSRLISGAPADLSLMKYASREYRQRFAKFLESIKGLELRRAQAEKPDSIFMSKDPTGEYEISP